MLKAWKNVYQKKTNLSSSTEKWNERESAKDNILEDVGRAVKLLLQCGLVEEAITSNCWIANHFCLRVDEALKHGLRRSALGYWPLARIFTHANNVQLLENLTSKQNTPERGRVWLHFSLNEGSLESYIRLFASECSALNKHYCRDALLRDGKRRDLLLALLGSVRDVHFELALEQCDVEAAATPLPSPEDSGVALLDSDLSEPLDSLQDDPDDDTATLNELEDNRINRLLSLEMDTAVKCCTDQLKEQSETTKTEDTIVLRPSKKPFNESNRHLKRVSFHEECFSQNAFSVSFLGTGTTMAKKDTVKGRYSWCAGGDAPYVLCDSSEQKTNSLCLLHPECGEERGVPEGQEDMCKYSEETSKADVMKMRRRHLLKKSGKLRKSSLHWPGAKANLQACQQVLDELERELEHNVQQVVEPIAIETLNVMRSKIFFSPSESVYKLFKAYGPLMQSEMFPLLIVLTNKAVYVLSSDIETFVCHFALTYMEVEAILVGPGGESVMLAGSQQRRILVAMNACAEELLSALELAMRRARVRLPAWRCLDIEDMIWLRHNLVQLLPALQGEQVLHLCLAHLQSKQCVPQAATKEGLLMMRIGHEGPWMTAFLALRESELWVYGDEVEREPQLVLSLARCQGCHRAAAAARPHTFEILCGRGSAPLQLAAADEYEASDWLQALVQAASGPAGSLQQSRLQLCGLVLSAGHVLAYSMDQHVPQLLCYAGLPHLTALRTDSAASNWCILEFECSEAQESSGDWILYFASQTCKMTFCKQLEALWPTMFEAALPSTSGINEKLVHRCTEMSMELRSMWEPVLNPQP